MTSTIGIILFLVGLTLSIALHEWGHLITAKIFGMRAERYFIGFGPTVWSFQRGETEYGLKWFPLGGFVRIAGMSEADERQEAVPDAVFDQEAVGEDRRSDGERSSRDLSTVPAVPESTWRRLDRELEDRGVPARQRRTIIDETRQRAGSSASAPEVADTFRRVAEEHLPETEDVGDLRHRVLRGDDGRFFHDRPAWQRTIVLGAGSAMHFVIALVLLFVGFWAFGVQTDEPLPVIDIVQPESPAAAAGLQSGDRIVAVDGQAVDSFDAARDRIGSNPGEPVQLTIERDGSRQQVDLRTILSVPRDIAPDGTLADAGFAPNDVIVAVDGATIQTPDDLREAADRGGESTVTVRRPVAPDEYERTEVEGVPAAALDHLAGQVRGLVGFFPAYGDYGPVEALGATFVGEGSFPDLVVRTFRGLGEIFGPNGIGSIPEQLSGQQREVGEATLLSPVGLASLAGQTAESGPFLLVGILVALNIFVGIFNLFPLPPLDGGHLAVLGVEQSVNGVRRLRGRTPDFKVDPRTVTAIAIPVIALMGVLFLTVVFLDITNPLVLPQ